MLGAFPHWLATMSLKVSKQIAPLHLDDYKFLAVNCAAVSLALCDLPISLEEQGERIP